MLEIYDRRLPGGVLRGSTCTTNVAVAGQKTLSPLSSPPLPKLPATTILSDVVRHMTLERKILGSGLELDPYSLAFGGFVVTCGYS
jgi:hypothetical protein